MEKELSGRKTKTWKEVTMRRKAGLVMEENVKK